MNIKPLNLETLSDLIAQAFSKYSDLTNIASYLNKNLTEILELSLEYKEWDIEHFISLCLGFHLADKLPNSKLMGNQPIYEFTYQGTMTLPIPKGEIQNISEGLMMLNHHFKGNLDYFKYCTKQNNILNQATPKALIKLLDSSSNLPSTPMIIKNKLRKNISDTGVKKAHTKLIEKTYKEAKIKTPESIWNILREKHLNKEIHIIEEITSWDDPGATIIWHNNSLSGNERTTQKVTFRNIISNIKKSK